MSPGCLYSVYCTNEDRKIAIIFITVIMTLIATAAITITLAITITNTTMTVAFSITSALDCFVVEVARSATEDHISRAFAWYELADFAKGSSCNDVMSLNRCLSRLLIFQIIL